MHEVASREITYAEGIREALDQAMARDSNVVVIGEGVPDPKSIFNTTANLREKYGERRIYDMPLSENAVTGICVGASLSGIRPVLIHQRIDFSLLSMDQLVNNAAKWFYMFNGQASVPIVVRMIIGRGWGQGPQHSQSLHNMFAQVPGLKVVMPATPHDAKGMLLAAIQDDNPVIFIEHRWLHNIKGVVPSHYYTVDLDSGKRIHEGSDVTIAAFSYMVIECLAVAKLLKLELGITVDVIDMRSVRPLDAPKVISSLRNTGRLIVVDTASKTGGVGGELIAQVAEQDFSVFKKAPIRINCPDYPAPTSQYMTKEYYPGALEIIKSIFEILDLQADGEDYNKVAKLFQNIGPHDVPSSAFQGPF